MLFDVKAEGGEQITRLLGVSSDVEDASLSIWHQLYAVHSFGLFTEALDHCAQVEAPLRWDAALPTKVEGEILHCLASFHRRSSARNAFRSDRKMPNHIKGLPTIYTFF